MLRILLTPYIRAGFSNFCHVGLCFCVLSAHMTWRYVDHPIHVLKINRHSSLKPGVRGAILIVGELFLK